MIIAIATQENSQNATVYPHFGRCLWFCIYDTQRHESSFIENPASQEKQNAGLEAAQLLMSMDVTMVMAGRFGIKVVELFRENNIQMVIPDGEKKLSELINLIK